MDRVLLKAREYEAEREKQIQSALRPEFHLSARVGWMNDPNGFSYYNGEYHLFYQYHPYDCYWGPMHWGHAVSRDLLHWRHLPAALAPDTEYDCSGCFSGSAAVLEDGRHLLMYTGVSKETMSDGTVHEVQKQCIAFGDGKEYVKYEGNPVLDASDLPEGSRRFDFRDPKIWRGSDGMFRCVAGNCTEEKDGRILLFKSHDGVKWKFEKILISNSGRFGRMWECPDFFPLDGKQVLLISPQDMLPMGLEYHNGNGTVCLIGEYDEATDTFREEYDQAIDYGIDFYAPQTVEAPDGRRIMIGWMQNWDTCKSRSVAHSWFGQMSIPRELHIRDGWLIQCPVKEIETLWSNRISYENVLVQDVLRLEKISGRKIDMELTVRPADDQEMYRKFAVWFAENDNFHTSVSFRPYESVLKIDRKFSGSRRAVIHQRRCRAESKNGELKIRIILDNFSVEVFVNDGEQVLTATFYTDPAADGILFRSDGKVRMDIVKYDLTSK